MGHVLSGICVRRRCAVDTFVEQVLSRDSMLRQVENGTELALEVAMAELPPGERPRSGDAGSAQPSPRADMVEEVSAPVLNLTCMPCPRSVK